MNHIPIFVYYLLTFYTFIIHILAYCVKDLTSCRGVKYWSTILLNEEFLEI